MSTNGQTKLNCTFNRISVHDGQCARKSQINGTGLCVGFCAKGRCCARENFTFGGKLGVGLKPNHHLIALNQGAVHFASPSALWCQSVAT